MQVKCSPISSIHSYGTQIWIHAASLAADINPMFQIISEQPLPEQFFHVHLHPSCLDKWWLVYFVHSAFRHVSVVSSQLGQDEGLVTGPVFGVGQFVQPKHSRRNWHWRNFFFELEEYAARWVVVGHFARSLNCKGKLFLYSEIIFVYIDHSLSYRGLGVRSSSVSFSGAIWPTASCSELSLLHPWLLEWGA